MAFTKEQMREYRAKRKAEGNPVKSGPSGKSGQKARKELAFIAIDGEAMGESGYHLLAASTGDEIANPEGLSSEDCIRFLLALKDKYGSAIYCGYALGYDCEHWIRDFGPALWQQLKETGEGTIRLGGWTRTIQYIPRKWFKIGFYRNDKFIPIIQVFDVFSFFQASFLSTVGSPATGQKKGWGAATAEEMAVLEEWKAKRGEFAHEDWEAIRAYNQIECAVLVRLMGKLRAALQSADVHLSSWHGPGAVANYLLKKHDMGRHIGTPPEEAHEAIAHAYFGGRFQVFKFGHIEGVYDYDISSAYPHATTLLPSTQGRWERVDAYQGDDAPWTVYRVKWHTDAYAGDLTPLPWRSDTGVIHYPSYGHGWYWASEVAAAIRAFGDAITIEEGWRLYPTEEGVFGWMNDLASERVAAKQKARETEGEEREKWQGIERAYKLALNSVYGKTIQTVGTHRPFLCPMWAGLITAHTRARLMDAAALSPSTLVCFATDGLFCDAPNAGICCSSELGGWELEESKSNIRLELYQSGCYAIFKDGEMLDCRFRGVSRSDVPWDALRALWKKKGAAGTMSVPTKRFIGHRTALQRNKPELQCVWDDTPKDVALMPGTGFPIPGNKWYSALPYIDYSQLSARYRKLPAGETDFERDEMDVQP